MTYPIARIIQDFTSLSGVEVITTQIDSVENIQKRYPFFDGEKTIEFQDEYDHDTKIERIPFEVYEIEQIRLQNSQI